MGDLSTHFSRKEFACKCGCGFDTVDHETIAILEELRFAFGAVKINSGARCQYWNQHVGGSVNSLHLFGRAADIEVEHTDPVDVANYLDSMYPDKFGIGRYESFTHIDTRSGRKARW